MLPALEANALEVSCASTPNSFADAIALPLWPRPCFERLWLDRAEGRNVVGALRRAASIADFMADPLGRYWAGQRHCVFAHDATVLGFASWGRPDVDDVRAMLSACRFALEPGMVPYRWFVDLRGLELIEPATFALILEYTRTNRVALGKNIARQAQLRPDGLVGAIISGFAHVARLPYPDRVFSDAEEALGWLGIERRSGVELVAELDAIRSEARESHEIVARLRREIESSGALVADEAARRLGLSTRSFQRALRDAGTTYRMELKAFRVRRAQELLQGGRTLTWVAAELGFSSTQHFATAYRAAVGETPSAWRRRHQAGPGEGT